MIYKEFERKKEYKLIRAMNNMKSERHSKKHDLQRMETEEGLQIDLRYKWKVGEVLIFSNAQVLTYETETHTPSHITQFLKKCAFHKNINFRSE
jgi:alpha-ketoglutarate-dependent taurine dioxygenase